MDENKQNKNCGTAIQMEYHSAKNEQITDKHSKMEESIMHYAKWKKPDTKGEILYNAFI